MYYLAALIIITFTPIQFANAQSQLLESVKRNPSEANALCKKFREINSKGISSYSESTITEIARDKKLNSTDAEILSIYVIGMYCPEIY